MSALTSLLVRDDAVSVRQIEEALARQVVDGGELDTALLELSALPENKLIAYRAASERGQPATREEVMSASSATRALLPGELAIALQVAPISHDDTTLTVASVRGLKPVEITQLAERTGMQINVRITIELRLLAALERFYGHALLPRYAVLLNRVDAQPAGELVPVEPLQGAILRASMKTTPMPAFEEAEDFQAVLAAAFERASLSPHAGTPAVDPDETRPLSNKRAFEAQKKRARAAQETAKIGSGLIQVRPGESSVRVSAVPKPDEEQAAPADAATPAPVVPLAGHVPAPAAPVVPVAPVVVGQAPLEKAASARADSAASTPAEHSASARADSAASTPAEHSASARADSAASTPAEHSASARAESTESARAEQSASAPADTAASMRAEQSASAPADTAASMRAEQSAWARAEKAASARAEQSAWARAEKVASARAERSASTRAEHSASTRAEQSASARAEQSASARAEQSASVRAGKGVVAPVQKAPPPAAPKLSMADAQGALSTVEDRDAVLNIYFRYARQLFHASALFLLKDGRAVGAQAFNIQAPSDIRDISVPVMRGSALEELTRTLVPRVTDLGRKDEDRVFASALKRSDCQPAALVPICIKRRVVAVLYGDRGGEPLHMDELTDLLTLMPHATNAFERIIRARKLLGLSNPPSSIGDLSHAPTQRSIPAVQFGSEARTAELPEPAKNALKIPQVLPTTRGFGLPEDDGDIYATARIPIQPLPLDQFDSPPRYLSKPPPGTGRYQNVAPTGPGAQEVLRAPSTPAERRSDAGSSSERRSSFAPAPTAHRGSNAPPADRRNSVPPPDLGMRRSAAPNSASSHPSLAAPKPAPGSGIYHSQVGTTELINMPAGRRDEVVAPGARPRHESLRSESRAPVPANQNQEPEPPSVQAQITQLVDVLCRSQPNEEPPAIKALVALGEPALSALLARFPGPLWFDRRKPHARLPLGRDISPIARALDAFGDQATERLGPLLGSNMTEVRYYATLFAGDRVRPSLLDPLLERLFDDDPQIRLLVRDALPHYRKFNGFERVTERICERARTESAPLYERLAAIDAISMLRDASCVSTLIELISHQDKQICVPAHRALTLITCQDFGKSPRKWRSWLSANANRHRVEWLIEGLMHPEEPVRATAGLELQKLTQVYYGYVAAASKREREAAQKRYAEWWRTEGRTRIAT